MLTDFKVALVTGGTDRISATGQRLRENLRRETERREAEIAKSQKGALLIEEGLKEPSGTEPRIVAEAYLKQFARDLGQEITNPLYTGRSLARELAERGNDD